jgi:hypothetical protein
MSIEAVIKGMADAMSEAIAALESDPSGEAMLNWIREHGLADVLTFQESTILGVLAGKLVGAGARPEDVGVYVAMAMKLVDAQPLEPPRPPLRAV